MIRIGANVFALALAGCVMTPAPPPEAPTSASPTSFPSNANSQILLLRAWSGPWEDPSERTLGELAQVVLFSDGLVIADVSRVGNAREWRSTRLSQDELDAVVEAVADAEPRAVQRASGQDSGCADAAVQVIQVAGADGVVELAQYCLSTEIGLVPPNTPESVVVLSRLLDELEEQVEDGPAETTAALVPMVRVAPLSGG